MKFSIRAHAASQRVKHDTSMSVSGSSIKANTIGQLKSPRDESDEEPEQSPSKRRRFSPFEKSKTKFMKPVSYPSRSTIFEPETHLSSPQIQSLLSKSGRKTTNSVNFHITQPGVYISQLPTGQVWKDAITGKIVDVAEHNRKVDEYGEARYNEIRRMSREPMRDYKLLSASLAQPALKNNDYQSLEKQISQLDLNDGYDDLIESEISIGMSQLSIGIDDVLNGKTL